jgi:hypothetical protein
MTDRFTLLAMFEFSRSRLLATLDAIEKSGTNVQDALYWRPGPGRAHIAWQFLHCAATHDRYINMRLRGQPAPKDPALCDAFGGGSTPADARTHTPAQIRAALDTHYTGLKDYLKTADLEASIDFPNNVKRTVGESGLLLAWHEAHHQGQIHLTWNLYKAAHQIK